MVKKQSLIELFTGLISGIMAAFLGGWLGDALSPNQGLGSLAGVIGGMLIAFPLGVGVGMGFVAHRLYQHKRPWLGVAGAILGILLIVLLAEPTGLNQRTSLLATAAIFTCCLSAWAALHLPEKLA